jgi:hypothetical protein
MESIMKVSFRTGYIAVLGTVGTVLSLGGLFSPATAFSDKNLSVSALSNLRAFAAAEAMMALFALYSLAKKHYQDAALIFLLISTIGWTIGQVISYFADGKPTSLVVIAIVVQAAFIPLTWMALKKK